MNKRQTIYISMGSGQLYPNGYFTFKDFTLSEARSLMHHWVGDRWSFAYEQDDITPDKFEKVSMYPVKTITREELPSNLEER